MKQNMGKTDKMIRIIIAAIIAILFFTKIISGTIGIIALAFAVILVLTSFLKFCPLYLPFGINTKGKDE